VIDSKDFPALNFHRYFMQKALVLAEKAEREGEVPVGAIVVQGDRIIGQGYNQTETLNDPTAHAEMIAISAACATLESKQLTDCSLYVTLEPCPMCAGASVLSRLNRVVFGAPDEKAGACGTLFNIADNRQLNHRSEVIQGILEADCRYLLQEFFSKKR